MTLAFDPSDDMAQAADGLEMVTLRRRGSTPGGPGTDDRPRPAPQRQLAGGGCFRRTLHDRRRHLALAGRRT